VKSIDNLGIGGVARVALTYAYDNEGNIKTVTDTINGGVGGATTYDYDALNRATQITQSGTGITNKRVKLTYNAMGQMETLQRLTGTIFTQSVATTTYGYNDPLNRLTQIQHANALGTTLSSFAFTYDSGSRIKKIQNADSTSVNYDYASNNELKAADYSPVARVDEAYTYDANGNRTNAGYVTGSNNQLSADGKYLYTYDAEGNLKTRKDLGTNVIRTFNWDYRNRLTSVVEGASTIVSYTYDANNQRISKTVGSVVTRYVYDRDNVTMEFNGTVATPGTTPTVRYLYGMQVDQILAQDKGSGNVSWDLTDQLGSVRALVGNDGVLRNRYEYDAFGSLNSSMAGATDDSRYRYTGREFDAETGLHYYRARYFDSNSGRFISQDPIGFKGGDSNLYRYVVNDSVNFNDPSGNIPLRPGTTAGPLAWARDKARRLNNEYKGWMNDLPNCPNTKKRADENSQEWTHEKFLGDDPFWLQRYHKGAKSSYRSKPRSFKINGVEISKVGQQCTYDKAGQLIIAGRAAGTPDFWAPVGIDATIKHREWDVETWEVLGWEEFNRTWIPNQGEGLVAQGKRT
jgi:RHS repeat-associated protein